MLRTTFCATLFTFLCLGSPVSADIIVTATTEMTQNDTQAIVTYNLYAGSSTSSSVGVAKYSVSVDVSTLATHLSTPISPSSAIFANPNGTTTASVWATPGSGFASFGGSPGGVSGNVVTFTGDVGNSFLGNVTVTQHAQNTQHRLGSITLEFLRPSTADLNLSLTPVSATFQAYDPKLGSGMKTLTTSVGGTSFTINKLDVVPEPGSALALLGVVVCTCLARRRR